MKKITTVVGARPQFIKAAVVSRILRRHFHERLIHTGQHYDREMSENIFTELEMPDPDLNLGIGSLSQGAQTGRMIEAIEKDLIENRPDMVLVYGDTNSTIAGAMAAVKLHIPIAHVEAGLRSNNRRMPEEINRILTDHISSLLFPPCQRCVEILRSEGITEGVAVSGDVMLDMVMLVLPRVQKRLQTITGQMGITQDKYYFSTLHRAENTSDRETLEKALSLLNSLDCPVIFAIHPRTRDLVRKFDLSDILENGNIRAIPPQPYIDTLALQLGSRAVLTDSGGMQKEAFWLGRKCVTLRGETEWDETVNDGFNFIVGLDRERFNNAISGQLPARKPSPHYGEGRAAEKISQSIKNFLGN